MPIVQVDNLTKHYGDIVAVDGVSFSIEEGEIFGLLGPNGAGKTTTISVLSCLFPPTAGTAAIAGYDIVRQQGQVKKLIGIVPQELALYPTLSAGDNLTFFGRIYGLWGKELRVKIDKVLEIVGLRERAKDTVATYSGGMKRRLNMAAGLLHEPRLLFLDEPTVGVDPQSRNHIFESVQRLNQETGMTILYTSHYMEEVELLCQRVGIIDHGKLIVCDTVRNLVNLLGGGVIHLGLSRSDAEVVGRLGALSSVSELRPIDGRLKIQAVDARAALLDIIALLSTLDVTINSLEILEPNLESVFLHLTGSRLRD